MKITVVGCQSGYPTQHLATSCYLVQDNNTNIVIDMGAGSLSALQEYINISDVNSILLTHFHPDHYSDVLCYQHAYLINKQLAQPVRKSTIYAVNHEPYIHLLDNKYDIDIQTITPESKLIIGSLTVDFCATKHSMLGVSVRISNGQSSFVYTSDTEYNEALVSLVKDTDVLLCECSLYERVEQIKGHMYPQAVKTLIEQATPKQAVLVHLPAYGDNTHLLDAFAPSHHVILGHKGLSINI